MKKTCIVTDSVSGISQEEAKELGIRVLAMPFYIDDENYKEGVDLDKETFFRKQAEGAKISTSQPSPSDVTDLWDEVLKEYEEILYMPVSSGLSGSYQTAAALSQDEAYEGKVFVSDHGTIATPLRHVITNCLRAIEEGKSAEEIKELSEKAIDGIRIYVTVDTLKYLKNSGRITPAAAVLGGLLNIKPILSLGSGKLDAFKKCRGLHKAKKEMFEALRKDIEENFKEEYENGKLQILAACSGSSKEEMDAWTKEVEEAFPGHSVINDPITLVISCHTGPGVLGVGCSLNF